MNPISSATSSLLGTSDSSQHKKVFIPMKKIQQTASNTLKSDPFYHIWTPADEDINFFKVFIPWYARGLPLKTNAWTVSNFLDALDGKEFPSHINLIPTSHKINALTPLMLDVLKNNKDKVKASSLSKEEINQQTNFGISALHIAALKGHKEIIDDLRLKKGDLQIEDEGSLTPLLMACFQGHEEIVLSLLTHLSFEDLNHVDQRGNSALILAISNGHLSIAKHLLEKGCNPTLANDEGVSPLMVAAFFGHEDIVSLLLNDYLFERDIDTFEESKKTALFFACLKSDKKTQETQKKIVELLLNQGADPFFKNTEGATPLRAAICANNPLILPSMFEAACKKDPCYLTSEDSYIDLRYALIGNNQEAISFYLRSSMDLTLQFQDGVTFLMITASNGQKELMEQILKIDSSPSFINAQNVGGATALNLASYNGHKEIVAILLKHHADRFITSESGESPLTASSVKNHTTIILELLKDLDEKKKTDYLTQENQKKETSLTLAIRSRQIESVQILIKEGYPLNWINESKKTPLNIACEVQGIPLDIVEALLEKINNAELASYVNHEDLDQNTPVHLALKNKNFHLVDGLLAKGGDLLILNQEKKSPFLYAIQSENIDLILKLLKHILEKHPLIDLKKFNQKDIHQHIAKAILEKDDPNSLNEIISYGIDIFSTQDQFSLFMKSIHLNKRNLFGFLFRRDFIYKKFNRGQTPLMIACSNTDLRLAETILNTPEVDIRAQDDDKDNALMYLLMKEQTSKRHKEERALFYQIFHRLIDSYDITDINHVNKKGVSAFLLSCQLEDPSFADSLIKKGCDYLTKIPDSGANALMIACSQANKALFDLLIKLPFPPSYLSEVDKEGDSLLSVLSFSGQSEIFSTLLEKGLSFETTNKNEKTPLMIASYHGHLNIVEQILRKASYSYINQKQPSSNHHALFFAVKTNQLTILEKLISKGSDHRVIDHEGTDLLNYAIKHSHSSIVQFLLPHFSIHQINALDRRGCSALTYAAERNNYLIMKGLLEKWSTPISILCQGNPLKGLLAKEKNHQRFRLFLKYIDTAEKIQILLANNTLIFKSIKREQHVLTKWLIEKGADLKFLHDFMTNPFAKREKITPLMLAVALEQEQIVSLITKAVSEDDINKQNENGLSALLIAVKKGNLSLVNHLLKNGAVAHLTNKNKISPLLLACYQGDEKSVKALLPRLSVADINLKDPLGYTPIMIAAQKGDSLIISHLLEFKADPSLENHDQETALLLAVKSHSYEALSVFLNSPFSYKYINHPNKEGRTALMLASLQGSEEMREALREENANPFLKDKYGLTADDLFHIVQNVNSSSSAESETLGKSSFDWLVQSIYDNDHDLMDGILAKIDEKTINQKTKEGETLLTIAGRLESQTITKKLLDHQADPFMFNSDLERAISLAIDQEDEPLLERLLVKASKLDQEKLKKYLTVKDKSGTSLIDRAVLSDNLKRIISKYVKRDVWHESSASQDQKDQLDLMSILNRHSRRNKGFSAPIVIGERPYAPIIFPPLNTLAFRKKPNAEKQEEKQPLIRNHDSYDDRNRCIIS
ncbi:MAG: ankyrin repeat domain-containing protein [Rhabdochlamydiaceae bacterium]